MSFSIAEAELKQMDISLTIGDYAVWSYFQSIDSQINKDFIENFKERYGADRVITDPMEAAYFGVYLWSKAVFLAQSSDPEKVIDKIANQSKKAPEGLVYTDGFNHHTWKYSRIGKINNQGQFDIQWSSGNAIYPIVYPYKSSDAWNDILNDLYQQWGGKWAKE
jgi:urea transport system substrate-binding protein